MRDLISREELLEIAEQQGHITIDDILSCETVTSEVKRGQWIRVDGSYWKWKEHGAISVAKITYKCSECERRTAVKSSYCPNCGADMRGDTDHAAAKNPR